MNVLKDILWTDPYSAHLNLLKLVSYNSAHILLNSATTWRKSVKLFFVDT